MILSLEEDSGGKGGVSWETRESVLGDSRLCRALDGGKSVQTKGGCSVWRGAGENQESSECFQDGERFCLGQSGLTFLDAELCGTSSGWEEPECFLKRILKVIGMEFLEIWVGRISWEEISESDLWRTSGRLLETGWDCDVW